jgi:hypothetical protein
MTHRDLVSACFSALGENVRASATENGGVYLTGTDARTIARALFGWVGDNTVSGGAAGAPAGAGAAGTSVAAADSAAAAAAAATTAATAAAATGASGADNAAVQLADACRAALGLLLHPVLTGTGGVWASADDARALSAALPQRLGGRGDARSWAALEGAFALAERRCATLERAVAARRCRAAGAGGEPQPDEGDALWSRLCAHARSSPLGPVQQRSSARVALLMEELYTGGQRTWQRSQRARHQPQIESLLAQLAQPGLCGLSGSGDGGGGGDGEGGHRVPILLELGAGKALFARVGQQLCACHAIAVDRRACDSRNYDGFDGTAAAGDDAAVPSAAMEYVNDHGGALGTSDEGEGEGEDSDVDGDLDGPVASESDSAAVDGASAAGGGGTAAAAARSSTRCVVRVHADVRDLALSELLAEARFRDGDGAARRTVVTAKHLCAGATDLAIECLRRGCVGRGAGAVDVAAALIAPCCHPQIVAADFFAQHGAWLAPRGFSVADVGAMTRLLAWGKLVDGGAFHAQHVLGAPAPMGEQWLRARGWVVGG